MRLAAILLLALSNTLIAGEWGDLTPPADVPVQLPDGYDPNTPAPLLILLHGYSPLSGPWTDTFAYHFAIPARERGYILVRPTGSSDGFGYFWNGSEACCDFGGANPDHVAYLLALVDHLEATYAVDPRHIHLMGHSSGGFMAHRMGCEHPDRFASIVSLSGMGPSSMDGCTATNALNVLQFHGTLDVIIWPGGGPLNGTTYPSVYTTLTNWALHLGCDETPQTHDEWINLDLAIWGDETQITSYTPGCSTGEVRGWDAYLSGHLFTFGAEAMDHFFDWFATHPAPDSCTADLTGDGVVAVEDLLMLLAHWGTDGGDIDGDGTSDVVDLLAMLALWGECP
ncbi:MAG: alpha/beta fold hydrolase [Phycisphaerales bacterium]|nr:alpha/beta fold hydrolase [Phycisphaerales bacterium]